MTIYPPQLPQELEHSTIFLDTNVFGCAAKSEGFFDLLLELRNNRSCAFITIPSVVFEFTNGSSTLDIYNQRADFINTLVDSIVDPHAFSSKLKDFAVVMSKINASNKAYTDFLLSLCLYNWQHIEKVYLLTADLKALPGFFERKYLVSTEEKGNEVRNFGLYAFNAAKYVAAAQSTANGKRLNTLTVFDGKVLAAYGDYGANTGPVAINPFDTLSSSFDGSALSVPTEQLDNWKVIDGKLYSTTVDPTCSGTCSAGYAVYTPGSSWEMKTPVNAEHIFDVETLTGTDIWLFGASGGDTATAWRSTDGGTSFSVVRTHTTNPGASNTEHYAWGAALNGKMYLQAQLGLANSALQIYDNANNTWSEGSTTAICTSVDTDTVGAPSPVVFSESIVCPNTNGIKVFDGTTVTSKSSASQFPNLMPSCNTVAGDITVYDNLLYVLCGNNRNIMKTSTDMSQWATIGTAPTGAKSFAIDATNHMIYVGTTDSKLYRSSLLADTENPEVTIDLPTDGTVFHESHIYASATASDDETIEKVEFYLGDTLISTDNQAPYDINWENSWTNGVADVPAGEYALTAKAYDISGNTTVSDPVTIELVSDGSINTVYQDTDVQYWGLAVDGDHTWSVSYTKDDDQYTIGIAKVSVVSGDIEYINSSYSDTYGASSEAFFSGTPLALAPDGKLWFSHYDSNTDAFNMI